MLPNSLKERLKRATSSNRGQILTEEGEYLLTVKRLHWIVEGYKGDTFIAEHEVTSSKGDGAAPVGSSRNIVHNLGNVNNRSIREGDIMGYLGTLLGATSDQVADKMDAICGSTNMGTTPPTVSGDSEAFRGAQIRVTVFKNSKGFTSYQYENVKMSREEMRAQRVRLDGAQSRQA